MSGFQIVVLWSDMLIWLLVAAGIGVGLLAPAASATPIESSSAWSYSGDSYAQPLQRVIGAGDMTGDGLPEVVAALPQTYPDEGDSAELRFFYGSGDGLSTSPDATVYGPGGGNRKYLLINL